MDKDNCITEVPKIPIPMKHSSAFVDINGDCVNDILLQSKLGDKNYLEFWIGMKEENEIKYCFKERKFIDNELGLFSIVDINVDGQLDLAFPITNSQPPKVYVAYNQIKIENDWTVNYCDTARSIQYHQNDTIFSNFEINVEDNVIIIFICFNILVYANIQLNK